MGVVGVGCWSYVNLDKMANSGVYGRAGACEEKFEHFLLLTAEP